MTAFRVHGSMFWFTFGFTFELSFAFSVPVLVLARVQIVRQESL